MLTGVSPRRVGAKPHYGTPLSPNANRSPNRNRKPNQNANQRALGLKPNQSPNANPRAPLLTNVLPHPKQNHRKNHKGKFITNTEYRMVE
ncbi:MAG: hypothetical protein EBU90_22520 [Proteobacteria bacterium]|nr:hypothetical protein [Pseudomonadota bacterium]